VKRRINDAIRNVAKTEMVRSGRTRRSRPVSLAIKPNWGYP